MKKTSIFLASMVFLNAQTIHQLFDAVKNLPETKIDNLKVKETKIAKRPKSQKKRSLLPFIRKLTFSVTRSITTRSCP